MERNPTKSGKVFYFGKRTSINSSFDLLLNVHIHYFGKLLEEFRLVWMVSGGCNDEVFRGTMKLGFMVKVQKSGLLFKRFCFLMLELIVDLECFTNFK